MNKDLIKLSNAYLEAGNAIHDAVRDIIKNAGGFLNAANKQPGKNGTKTRGCDTQNG